MSKVKVDQFRETEVAWGEVRESILGYWHVVRFVQPDGYGHVVRCHRYAKTKHQAIKMLRDWLRYNR